jgi:F-type H+-transporting ATPase subunit c
MIKMFAIFAILFLAAMPVMAQETAVTPGGTNWAPIAAGFGMAIASAGCGLAQGRAVAASAEAMARNPGAAGAIRGALILGLVLIESLALYTLVIIILRV